MQQQLMLDGDDLGDDGDGATWKCWAEPMVAGRGRLLPLLLVVVVAEGPWGSAASLSWGDALG